MSALRVCVLSLSLASANAAVAQAPPVTPAPPTPSAPPTVGEVVVKGGRPAVTTAIDRRSYSISSDLQAQGGSVADALRNVPSVEVDVQGNVSLRGDSNVTILIDGKPAGRFENGNKGQALQDLPAERIDRVEVLTNPSAEFGSNGAAGIINLITKKAQGAGRTASGRLSFGTSQRYTSSISGGYNGPRLSGTADAFYRHDTQKQVRHDTRADLDVVSGTSLSQQDSLQHANIDVGSAGVDADYDLDTRTRLSGGARFQYGETRFLNLSGFTRTEEGRSTDGYTRQFRVAQNRSATDLDAGLRRRFEDVGHEISLHVSYDAARDRRRRDGETDFDGAPQTISLDRQRVRNDAQKVLFKADYVRQVGQAATVKAGVAVQFDNNQYGVVGARGTSFSALMPDPGLTDLFKFDQRLIQAYLTYERPLGPVSVLAGLRLEDMHLDLDRSLVGGRDANDDRRLNPSLHLSWPVTSRQTLTASYSRRVQRPQPEEFNAFPVFLDPVNYRAGNPRLRPQLTDLVEVGYQFQDDPLLVLATIYYRQSENVVADVIRSSHGIFLSTRQNVSGSESAGVEVAANGKLPHGFGYGVSANAAWTQLDTAGLGPGFGARRSATTLSGKLNLTWQATSDDFLQLSGELTGKRLTPQGHVAPSGTLDLGYRHQLSDRVAVLLIAQDLLSTYRDRQVIDTLALKARLNRQVDARTFLVRFVWRTGGKPKDVSSDLSGERSF